MNIGGQAVVEGVMMRNQERFAVAVRLPNGRIKVLKEQNASYPKIFNVIFIRGIVGLAFMLLDGIKALTWSSNQQLGKDEQLSAKELTITITTSLLAGILIFVAIPFFTARWVVADGVWFDVLDGLLRVALLVGYLGAISFLKDVRTLFQYHGAEHKAIYCYEAKQKVNPGNVKQFSRFHHRCGTSFIFIVIVISIILFSLIDGAWWIKLLGRILLLPVIAGISYELLKLGDKFHGSFIVRGIIAPGLWLQRITTREPTEKQIEVAIKSLEGVVE